jgi:hypothetical protein
MYFAIEASFDSLTSITSLIWLILILLSLGMFALIAGRMVDVYLAMSCQKSGAAGPQISSHGFPSNQVKYKWWLRLRHITINMVKGEA